MIYLHENLSSVLKENLSARQFKNHAYSMRAFARDIGLSVSHLSQVMQGTKSLSSTSALKVASSLGLQGEEKDYFDLLTKINLSSDEVEKKKLELEAASYRTRHAVRLREADELNLIKEWYHIPILEMYYLSDFDFNAANIANRLGISPMQSEVALSRLCRMGLLKQEVDGFSKTETNTVFRSTERHNAFKTFHTQMIDKAQQAVDGIAVERRVISSQTFCMDQNLLGEAKEIIRNFTRKMTDLFAKSEKRDEIYQLNVQFFDLSDHSEGE